jgi:signal transduction histidine kinase
MDARLDQVVGDWMLTQKQADQIRKSGGPGNHGGPGPAACRVDPVGRVATTITAGGGEVTFIVDDGSGIPVGDREEVFERFHRGDTAGSDGSGLGLSPIRQQPRLDGRDVTVGESPSGEARFRVRLG